MMTEWCKATGMPMHVLLTKADKLKKGPAQSTMLKIKKQLKAELGDNVTVQTFSALKRQGIDQLTMRIDSWLLEDMEQEGDVQDTEE